MSSDPKLELIGRKFANNRFKIISYVASGSFGLIFKAKERYTKTEFAVKLEPRDVDGPQLPHEYELYKKLGIHSGVPQTHFYGKLDEYNCLVLQLLGPSIDNLFDECDKRFSVKTATLLAIQMIDIFEYIHSKGIIFRDVKPENFLLGLQNTKQSQDLYLIDFGLAKAYLDSNGRHISYKEDKGLTGTVRYMSINANNGNEQSRRDDMEAVGHLLIYLLKSRLPWQGLTIPNDRHRFDKISEIKQKTKPEVLCKDLPEEYLQYLNDVRSLQFTQKPNYSKYKALFENLLTKIGENLDYIYDWNEKQNLKSKKRKKMLGSSEIGLVGSKP